MVSLLISTPPVAAKPTCVALNSISLYWVPTTGCNFAPCPLPPVITADNTRLIVKFCGSTKTLFTDPRTTACARAVVPTPTGPGTIIDGGLITS